MGFGFRRLTEQSNLDLGNDLNRRHLNYFFTTIIIYLTVYSKEFAGNQSNHQKSSPTHSTL